MRINSLVLLKLFAMTGLASSATAKHTGGDIEEGDQDRELSFFPWGGGRKPTLRQRRRRCDKYEGSGKQKFTFVAPDFAASQDPATLKPGDFFVSIVDKPLFELVEFGINTCQIVSIDGPLSPFPNYELSCHLMARSPDGDTFTASGDGAPNGFLDDPQISKYAITGGTGIFLGAWGEFDFVFSQLSIDPVSGFPISEFDFELKLCF